MKNLKITEACSIKGEHQPVGTILKNVDVHLAAELVTAGRAVEIRKDDIETREPEVEHREPEVETREPEVETREPEVETREPEVEHREPEVEHREPKPAKKTKESE